jgi:2-methylcitrate dehydratase
MDPDASRETLDHSVMYILAVAWEDGSWHHVRSYTPERAHKLSTVALWHKIRTEEVTEWTEAYHNPDPEHKKFGAEVVVDLKDGSQISERLDNPNAHYLGARPFARADYVNKLRVLTEGLAESSEVDRFLGLVERLQDLSPEEVGALNLVIPENALEDAASDRVGIL